jgi:hypothetical protein
VLSTGELISSPVFFWRPFGGNALYLSWFNPDSAVPADAMSEEQTFRSEVNGSLEMKGMMEYWSVGAETHYSITPLLQPHEVHVP